MVRDLAEMLGEGKPIRLPIAGTVYEFPSSIPARTGLLLLEMKRQVQTADSDDYVRELLGDEEALNMRRELLGDGLMAMVRAGLHMRYVDVVFSFLIAWHTTGSEAAEAWWDSLGGSMEAAAQPPPSTGTGEENATLTPASSSGTSSPTATDQLKQTAAA